MINNKNRRFGQAGEYVYVRVEGEDGLATEHEARVMQQRARANPEDLPTWWDKIKELLKGN